MTGHGEPDEETQASARALNEAARRVAAKGHPDPDLLLAYRERRLGEVEAAKVRSHLVLCSDCADFVLDLAAFPEVPRRARTEIDLDALVPTWDEVCTAYEAQEEPSAPARRAVGGWAARAPGLLAAGLAVVVALLTLRLSSLSRELAHERAPQANAPSLTLAAEGAARTRGAQLPVLRVPAGARRVHLTLELGAAGEAQRYRGRVLALAGGTQRPVRTVDDLVPDTARRLSLSLHRRDLPPGTYRVRVEDPQDPDRRPIAEYTFRLEYDQPAPPR